MDVMLNAMFITIGVVLGLLASGVCLVGIALAVSWVMGTKEKEKR